MKIKKIIGIILFTISSLILLYSCVKLISWINDNNKIDKESKEINNIVKTSKTNSEDNSEIINPPDDENDDYWNFVNKDFNNVDFNELKNINSDTVAWIKVNNTNINYPVVQSNNNEYYLTHSFKKENNDAGWIFMDYRNNNFNDLNTIIYGHSRLDKSMFGSLKNILTKSWQDNKDNHVIYISNENENTLWQVFSTYSIETENYYIQTEFESDKEYEEFLDTITNRSVYNYNSTPNTDDKILTLSTCHNKSEKTVLHAKLIKRQRK